MSYMPKGEAMLAGATLDAEENCPRCGIVETAEKIFSCPNCKQPLNTGTEECPNCHQLLCPDCSAALTEDDIACPSCGVEFELYCPDCETPISSTAEICPSCGLVFEESD
jgi:RNA polymerase subunit RPABC4/transcription elongation factor Spt4